MAKKDYYTKEERQEYAKIYYLHNGEKIRDRQNAYYDKHRESIIKKNSERNKKYKLKKLNAL